MSAEFDIVHVRTFSCHPFAIDGPVVVGIGVQEDTAYNVFAAFGSSQLCLWGTETAECGITAQRQQDSGTRMQTYQIGVLFQGQRFFYHIPALRDVDVGILFYCFLENVRIIAETVSFGTQVAYVDPLFRRWERGSVTGI